MDLGEKLGDPNGSLHRACAPVKGTPPGAFAHRQTAQCAVVGDVGMRIEPATSCSRTG